MKNSAKLIGTFLVMSLFFVANLSAQEISWGITGEANMPMFKSNPMMLSPIPGVDIPINAIDPGNASEVGMGISGHIDYKINEQASIMATAGRSNWDLTSNNFINGKVTATPIMIGAKYFPVEGLYIGAKGGVTNVKTKVQTNVFIDITLASEKETLMSVGPMVGYELDLGKAKLDIGAQYQFVSNKFNYGGITAGIILPYGK